MKLQNLTMKCVFGHLGQDSYIFVTKLNRIIQCDHTQSLNRGHPGGVREGWVGLLLRNKSLTDKTASSNKSLWDKNVGSNLDGHVTNAPAYFKKQLS